MGRAAMTFALPHMFDQRLETERRLLAALYLWPRPVALEPHDFCYRMHAAFYAALQDVGNAITDDAEAIPIMCAAIKGGLDEDLFNFVGGVENFIVDELILVRVLEHEIDDLVTRVRACPRCGR